MEYWKGKIRDTVYWSEGIFKTDMNYVLRSGFWSTFGQFFFIASSFILSIVFAHFLEKEVYGNYKFILSLSSVLGALSLSGIGTAIIQAIAQNKDRVLKDGVKVSLKWGLLVTAVAIPIAIYYFVLGNMTIAMSFLIVGVFSPIVNAYGLYNSLFAGRKDFRRSTLYAVFAHILNTISVIMVAIFFPNALALVAIGFVFPAIIYFFLYQFVIKKYPLNNEGDDTLIEYGKHLSLMNFFGTLANQFDKILVFHWLGAAELAIYAFAIALPEQIRGSYKNIFGIALPKFSALSPENLRKSIRDKVFRLTVISILIALSYIALSPYFFQIFFPKYLDSVFYSQLYIIGLIFIPGISLFSMYFQVTKDTKTLYLVNIIGNVITVVLSIVFIYYFGLLGAVIENGLSWFSMFVVGAYLFWSRGKK